MACGRGAAATMPPSHSCTSSRPSSRQWCAWVRMGSVPLMPSSAITYACEQLSRLDERIAARQAKTMGNRTVRLDRLAEEIEYFARCDTELAPIIDQAERAADRTAADADVKPPGAPAGAARLWFRWHVGSQRGGAS